MRADDHSRAHESRYVVGELLGRGPFADVYAGYLVGDAGFQRPVAIKRLPPDVTADQARIERLVREASVLVDVQHGNIVRVLDLARDGKDVLLVMDLIDGPSLDQLLRKRGDRKLPLGIVSYIIESAAHGLEVAHARMVVHGDVHARNLLLTSSGELKVADFGCVPSDLRRACMAPEQIAGAPTPQSDVFALGVVLYELLTGTHPSGPTITPPRVYRPDLPAGLEAICMRALATERRHRYARMQHLIDALVEQRFLHRWSEGQSQLAALVREICATSPGRDPYATLVTSSPLTLATQSLLVGEPVNIPTAPSAFPRGSRRIVPRTSQLHPEKPAGHRVWSRPREIATIEVSHETISTRLQTQLFDREPPSKEPVKTRMADERTIRSNAYRAAALELANVYGSAARRGSHHGRRRAELRSALVVVAIGLVLAAGLIAALLWSGIRFDEITCRETGDEVDVRRMDLAMMSTSARNLGPHSESMRELGTQLAKSCTLA
jgi:serine/threonine protein kinase